MNEQKSRKPRPARLPEPDAVAPVAKPTPARDLGVAQPHESSAQPDASEVLLEGEDGEWRISVLGRSGQAGTRSPPLLLLGFWRSECAGGPPALEATVVARALSEVSVVRLRAALAGASPPPADDRPRPFFEGTNQGRRGSGPRRGS